MEISYIQARTTNQSFKADDDFLSNSQIDNQKSRKWSNWNHKFIHNASFRESKKVSTIQKGVHGSSKKIKIRMRDR